MIPARYPDCTALLIASGPSLSREQIDYCKPGRMAGKFAAFGCNDAYRMCEYLDVLYAADGRWIDHHRAHLPPRLRVGHRCWTPDKAAAKAYDEWTLVGQAARRGLSTSSDTLHLGNHSGYQLINLAYAMGCRRLVLIGYDCHSGGQHWFGKHPAGPLDVQTNYPRYAKTYHSIAEQTPSLGLTIINATPNSALDAFPMMDLRDALPGLGDL